MKRLTLVLLVLAGLTFVSCDNEPKNAMPPVYAGFKYEQKDDSLFVTAVQYAKGKLLNGTDYTFQLQHLQIVQEDGTLKDSTLTHKRHTNYDGTDSSNPVGRFRIPAGTLRPRLYTCTFEARFSNSADGAYGVSYTSMGGDTFKGRITSTSYILESSARGSVDIPIQ